MLSAIVDQAPTMAVRHGRKTLTIQPKVLSMSLLPEEMVELGIFHGRVRLTVVALESVRCIQHGG